MADYRLERDCRTPYSESYIISREEEQTGRVDLHYASGLVYATLCVSESITMEQVQDLIEFIDEEIVMSAEMYRDDFIVTVYQGRELGVFSDEEEDNNNQALS